MQRTLFLFLTTLFFKQASAQSTKLPVSIQEVDSIRDVTEPSISPDGKWVAYTVSSANQDADNFFSDIWMSSWDGTTTVQLTHTEDASESTPRWSPDNTQLAFMSSRTDSNESSQLWLLNRLGGAEEAVLPIAVGLKTVTQVVLGFQDDPVGGAVSHFPFAGRGFDDALVDAPAEGDLG